MKPRFFFATLGELMKLRAIFQRPNKASHENAAFDIVYSTFMTPTVPSGAPRTQWLFLKFGSSLETPICLEEWDTPCIVWESVTDTYRKFQVEKLREKTGVGPVLYPVHIHLSEKRITVAIGHQNIIRKHLWHFQFSDITLRNISRAAGQEKYYLNGEPFEMEQIEELQQPANNLVGDFLSEIL